MPLSKWNKTKIAVEKLENLLKCNSCGNILKDPCSINSCDHSFCRVCATKSINSSSKCPECGSFAWLKDIHVNRKLANVVEFCSNLKSLVHKDKNRDTCVTIESKNLEELDAGEITHDSNSSISNGNIEVNEPVSDDILDLNGRGSIENDKSSVTPTEKAIKAGANEDEDSEVYSEGTAEGLVEDADFIVENNAEKETNRAKDENYKEKDVGEAPDQNEDEICPSWPLSSKKPKKVIKTYSRLRYTNIAKKPRLNSPFKTLSSNSDSDFEHPVKDKHNSAAENNQSNCTMAPVSEQNIDLFVYDDDKVSEIEKELFCHVEEGNDNEVGKSSCAKKEIKERKRPVTRLRKKEKKTDAPEAETTESKVKKNAKGLKRKISSEVPKAAKKKSNSPLTKRNKKGETPLHIAAIKGNYDAAKDLLESGADPNLKDFAGWTPLHEACNHGRFEIVQLLLDNGAFIDIPGCDHDTPLHDAIANDRLEVAEFLITKGASLEVRNKQGMLPMDYVRSTEAKERILMAASIAQESKGTTATTLDTSTILRDTSETPKCILYSGLNAKEKKSLEKCVKTLSAEILDKFDEKVTHIVTSVDKDKICPRTMKNLLGVLTGKWIVSTLWIEECLKQKKWLNEEDFEVNGLSEGTAGAPKRARLNATMQFPALFDGCSFYLSGEFQSTPTKSEVLEIIRLGGGQLLHREPKVETSHPLIAPASPAVMKMMSSKSIEVPTVAYHAKPNTAQSHCTQYILYDKQSLECHKRISSPVLCTASTTWIMECISKFEIVEVKEP